MKKILLVPLSIIFILIGCADANHTGVDNAGTTNRDSVQVPLSSMSVDEAILETSSRMYYTELSDAAKTNILMFFNTFATGYAPDGQKINAGSNGGFGTMQNPHVASAVVQLFYFYAKGVSVPGLPADPSASNPFKALLSYSSLTNDAVIADTLSQIRAMPADTYGNIEIMFSTIVKSQQAIADIAKSYESRLLDSSSSASKTSGGGGTVLVDEYQVSANVAYVVALFPLFSNSTAIEANMDKVELVSKSLYDFNEASKLKLSYDKLLHYFNVYEIVTSDEITNIIVPVVTDILQNDIPGGTPIKGVNDDSLRGAVYRTDTTDYYLTDNITKRLYGAPAEQYISNRALNNTLSLHENLRKYGMKLPQGKTSDIGIENVSSTVVKYLRENGIVYKDFNKDSTSDVAGASFTTDVINKVFTTGTDYSKIIACQIVAEVNKAIDDSAKSYAPNKGYYTMDANGDLCGITIGVDERFDPTTAGTGTTTTVSY